MGVKQAGKFPIFDRDNLQVAGALIPLILHQKEVTPPPDNLKTLTESFVWSIRLRKYSGE